MLPMSVRSTTGDGFARCSPSCVGAAVIVVVCCCGFNQLRSGTNMLFRLGTAIPLLAGLTIACGGGGAPRDRRPQTPPAPPVGAPVPGPAATLDPPRTVGPATLTPQSSGTTAR